MSHSIMVPVTGQGTVVDQGVATYLPQLVRSQFGFRDVFLYSHGWWTTALTAMVDYSRFSVGMLEQIINATTTKNAPHPSALQVGIHWPAMISEDSQQLIDVLQPLTFYNRGAMADDVGEHAGGALMRLIVQAANNAKLSLRFHLIGHSFGCRVVCSALKSLIGDVGQAALGSHSYDLILLQAAVDTDAFKPGGPYDPVLAKGNGVPNLRMLITTSKKDTALGTAYPDAYRLVHLFGRTRNALGAVGPASGTPGYNSPTLVNVATGFRPPAFPANAFVVADLTALHTARVTSGAYKGTVFSGSHSDIYVDEVYQLITAFVL